MTGEFRTTPQEVERSTAHVNGIELSYLSEGEGPLVVLVHGFPETSSSWRHQFGPLASAGYRVVAPDMRGYGSSSSPQDVSAYSHFDLAADLVGLIQHLGESKAVVVGHDVGAALAWTMATVIPDRLRGIVALSVPHKPRGTQPPVAASPLLFYQRAFQKVGVEEADLNAKTRQFLLSIYDRLSGSSVLGPAPTLMIPDGGHFSDLFEVPAVIPRWLGEEQLARAVAAFERSGFRGALNWYRNFDRNWHLTAAWAPGDVSIPAAFLVGTEDVTWTMFKANGVIDSQIDRVPRLWDSKAIEGVGHWTAQEAPEQTSDFILSFLDHLDRREALADRRPHEKAKL